MNLCELAGPTGVGKSAIYAEMLKHGRFVTNPELTLEQARVIFSEGIPGSYKPFCDLLDWIFDNAKDHDGRLTKRASGTARAFAKWAVCKQPKCADDPRWMVVDGGLLHRGQGIDRLEPRMPVGRYFELMPLPDLVVLCRADEATLRERNHSRGGDHDRSDDIARALRCDALMRRILTARGANVLELDTVDTSPADNAAKVMEAIGTKRSFDGEHAKVYQKRREQNPKWDWEQSVIEDMLSDMEPGQWVLDCPVGTGRFLDLYVKQGLNVEAVDKSGDMLLQAARRPRQDAPSRLQLMWGKSHVNFTLADILTLSMPRKWVDAAVMCRLTRWLSVDECQQAMRNLQRIARSKIVFTTRVAHRNRPELSRPLELYPMDDWKVERVESLRGDEDYKVVELRPA